MSGSLLSLLGLSPYAAALSESSWRGIKFIVTDVVNTPQRNIAIHTFPYVQWPYAEDLGTAPEYLDVRGYLATANFGSPADVYGKSEKAFRLTLNSLFGPGLFVHPSLGAIKAVCLNASMAYSDKRLGIINLSLRFVCVDPNSAVVNAPKANTQFSLQSAVAGAISSITQGFSVAALGILSSGLGMAIGAALTVAAYVSTAVAICSDASSIAGETKGLNYITDDTVTLGRYGQGNLAQAPAALQAVDTTQSMPTIIAAGTTALRSAQVVAIASVTQANAALATAATGLSTATLTSFSAAAVTAVQTLGQAQNNPADQIRLLTAIAATTVPTALPGGVTTGNMIAWLALAQLAQTISNYQPTSSTDALTVLAQVTPVFQTAITEAGNVPDIVSFQALQSLFAGAWTDLTTRGAQLPPLITWTVPDQMPVCTLAQRLYTDGSRQDELVQRINCPAPLFCPASFLALSY